jgi:hypothetical protein
MFERLKALYRGAVYTVTDWYDFEKSLKDLSRAIPSSQPEIWIRYVAIHSTLSGDETVRIYNMCAKLHIKKFTRRIAKQLTKSVMEIADCGYSPAAFIAHLIQTQK